MEQATGSFAAGLCATREIGRAAALDPWRGEEVPPGPDADPVVDSDLHVRGISGLRVADAPVMTSALSANTNATVYAIAERAAGLIQAQPPAHATPSSTA